MTPKWELMKHSSPSPDSSGTDPVAEYLAEVEQIAEAAPVDFVDPHIEADIEREKRAAQMDREEGGIFSADPDASGLPTDDDIERGGIDDDFDPDADEEPATEAVKQHETPSDPLEKALAAVRSANPSLSIKQALALAEQIVAPEAVAQEEQAPVPPPISDLKAELKDLRQQHRKALRDYAEDSEIEAIEARMDEIEENLLPAAQQHEQQLQVQIVQTFEEHAAKAVNLYPDAAKEGSALYNRMAQIHADLEATGNPLVNSPDKALKIAQMAANELNIAPRRANPANPGTRSTAPMTRPLADPSQRTSSPRVTRVDEAIANLKSPEDWEALVGVG
jgi:hypothetical protein